MKILSLHVLNVILLLCIYTSSAFAHGPLPIQPGEIDFSKYPPIEDDINAMQHYGSKAQIAGQRLVERGAVVLDSIHEALSSPQSFPQQMQLITVLGEIADSGSSEIIIKSAQSSDSQYLYQNALLSLSKFDTNNGITEFVDQQLQNEKLPPVILRSALNYYAENPTTDATQWVDKYNQPNISSDVKFTALYLGGKLGMDSIKPDIVNMLTDKQSTVREYYLLLGLAEISTQDEFNQYLQTLNLHKENIHKLKDYIAFTKSPVDQQAEHAQQLIKSNDIALKKAAVNYLIKSENAEQLSEHWQQSNGFVRNAVKRAGYEIHVDGDTASLEHIDKHGSNNIQQLMYILAIISVIGIGIFVSVRHFKPTAGLSK